MDFVQPNLVELPEQPALPKTVAPEPNIPLDQVKLRTVNRNQTKLATIEVEALVPADHNARAVWELVCKMNLNEFGKRLRTQKGCVGRAAWDPQLLVSVWVYAYSEGISSAREIERLMEWEPGLQWLSGLETVNHHTLADFRVDHKKALDELFAQLLALMESAGMVSLEQIMHDGTKIRAQAGVDTFRREQTIRERLQQARAAVDQMADPREEQTSKSRRAAAQERAARQRAERLEAALQELREVQAEKKTEAEKEQARVSVQEPEARLMKHGDNAITPSYNAQISTESTNKIILGAQLTQCSSDAQSLIPAIKEVTRNMGKPPEEVVVDGGYTNRDNIVECAARQIDLVGSLPDPKERTAAAMKALGIAAQFAPSEFRILDNGKSLECPAGRILKRLRKNRKRGDLYQQYQASGTDCGSCRHQPQCCPSNPKGGRTVSIRLEERAEVAAFRKKMETKEYQEKYRKRGAVAEFPNAWIKEKLGVRKFRVRGLAKAGVELMWACLTYNIMQWVRLAWHRPATA